MRLNETQTALIRNCIRQSFGPRSRAWLFGSRTDDRRRGGDVDLYVEPEHTDLRTELYCKVKLQELLDLDVDLVVKRPGDELPIHAIARETGITL